MQILKDEIKEKILSSAEKTFLKFGYDKTTMREIADKTGMSVGNIYRYFKNKDSILDELIKDFGRDLKTFSDSKNLHVFKDTSQKMCNKYIDEFVDVLYKNKMAVKILSQNYSNVKIKKFEKMIIDSMADRINEVAKTIKKTNCNDEVCKAIASASIHGLKVIITDSKKKEQEVINDLKIYLNFILKDLMFRLKEI